MKTRLIFLLLLVVMATNAWAQGKSNSSDFSNAAGSIQRRLEQSIAELNDLREKAASQTIPLSRTLGNLENELSEARLAFQNASRLLDSHTLDLGNLRNEINSRKEESAYLSNVLSEYLRNFESRLHIAELQRYREQVEEARLAAENTALSGQELFERQAAVLEISIDRLEDALGGTRFSGTAVDGEGRVRTGTFLMVGPAALFQSESGELIGTAEQRLGSLEPAIIAFTNPEDAAVASSLITSGKGLFPLDPTLGNAHKIAAIEETLIEHIRKGGPVMIPIFVMAGAALLVALFKWLGLMLVRTPSQKRIRQVLDAISKHDEKDAQEKVRSIRGPVGRMLDAGVEHLREPRELIEEVMYEKVLATRLKLERFLPFIAICAASAPLLGLLGTVTGIINTFKLITVFGSGDVKTLSGGISEALITTEFGLIVAIPSLLIHAFLSRRARSVINQMEKAAVALVNQIGKTPFKNTYCNKEETA